MFRPMIDSSSAGDRSQPLPPASGASGLSRWPPAQSELAGADFGWWSPLPTLGPVGLYALAVLLLSTQPFFEFIYSRPDWRLITGIMWGSAFAIGLVVAVRIARFAWLMSSFRGLPFLWLALLVVVLSCSWSLEPAWSLYTVSWVVGITMVGIALGYLLSPRRLMQVLFWFFTLVLIGSLMAELLAMGRGLHRWTGMTPHPNYLGPITASAATYFAIATLHRRLALPIALPMCLLAVLITGMTQSATSIVMLVTGGGVIMSFWVGKRLRLGGNLAAILMILGLVVVVVVGLVRWYDTTSILGKDVTATNRTMIWDDAIGIIGYRPLSGFGFGAVWGIGRRTHFPEFRSTRYVWHAHNGYLHLATEAGLPAVALALVYVIRALARALADFVRWSSAFALFSMSYVVMFLIGNMTEARLFAAGLFDWLLMVILAAALAQVRTFQPDRPRPRPPSASAQPG